MVGDDEPVPVSGRPEIAQVIAETDGRRKLELFARYVSGVLERLSPLAPVLHGRGRRRRGRGAAAGRASSTVATRA